MTDFLQIRRADLVRANNKFSETSPVTPEDRAIFFLKCLEVNTDVDKIEYGGTPYLWDLRLYDLLKKGMNRGLAITNDWVKIVSSLTANISTLCGPIIAGFPEIVVSPGKMELI